MNSKIKAAAKPQNARQTGQRLLAYLTGSRLLILLLIGLAALGTLTVVIAPKILGNATTLIYEALQEGRAIDTRRLHTILALAAGLYAGQFLCACCQTRLMTVLAQQTAAALRADLKAKLGRVPVAFFDQNSNGNLMSIAVNDTDNVANSIQQSSGELIASLITIFGMLVVMLLISPRLTLLAVTMLPLSLLLMRYFLPRSQQRLRRFLAAQGRLNDQIEESYQGHAVIHCHNGAANALQAFDQTNEAMYASGWQAGFIGALMMKLVLALKSPVYVLIAVAGARFVAQGSLAIGDLQAFLIYAGLFSAPVTRLGLTFSEIVMGLASAERIFAVLDAAEMPAVRPSYENRPGGAKVSFAQVRFGYDDKPLLRDFSLDVREGQMIAIVGPTGAGKTTLVQLLAGFYEPQGGAIYVDGIDIRNLGKAQLRRKIGMVSQDTWLFSGSIYDNLKYGNKRATHEEVLAAARAAFVDDFVRALPDGYATRLNEEASNLSQGQRQLITIARAFLANPEILILNEATSNVDSRTEMLLQQAVKKLLQGRTSFVIAHRLSTIYGADRIVVMAKGAIAETGRHEQLVAADGVYAHIYHSQFAAV